MVRPKQFGKTSPPWPAMNGSVGSFLQRSQKLEQNELKEPQKTSRMASEGHAVGPAAHTVDQVLKNGLNKKSTGEFNEST